MRGAKRGLSPAAVAEDATARLDDRHLAEILLRLPSPASLARAALVSRRWRRISVSPAFLRQFRRLHSPQLVGFFICNAGSDPIFFRRMLPPPRGVGRATERCLDFSLHCLPKVDRWSLADARDGLLLLSSTVSDSGMVDVPRNFVVCDPLSRRSVLVQRAPTYQLSRESAYLGAALIVVDGGAGSSTLSFEVILVTYLHCGPRLSVFSSRTGQWSLLPEPRCGKSVMPMPDGKPVHTNGCVYWVMDDHSEAYAYLLVLDTRTKEFSTSIRLLASMRKQFGRSVRVMRNEDGELRIVDMAWRDLGLLIWRLDRSRSTKGRWVREEVHELANFQGAIELPGSNIQGRMQIMDAGEGIVFLKGLYGSHWVYAVSLEDRMVLKLPHNYFSSGPALPYRMTLSPPLPSQAQGRDG